MFKFGNLATMQFNSLEMFLELQVYCNPRSLKINQLVTVPKDPEFLMGTTLLCSDIPSILLPFACILYHLVKLVNR